MKEESRLQDRRAVTECPVCDTRLFVSELSCPTCLTRLAGTFASPPLARLAPDQQDFVVTFVRCRGVIRDVERVLGISYPTVRARLDAVARSLDALTSAAAATAGGDLPPLPPAAPLPPNPPAAPSRATHARRLAVLEQVEQGVLEPAEAVEALRHL